MTGNKSGILIMIFMISLLNGFSQPVITNYTKDNGLTSNQITCHLVDSRGVVWLGTSKGINVYTGAKWNTIINIKNQATGKKEAIDHVRAIYEDGKGYVWVSCDNGIFCYLGKYWINFINKSDDEGYIPGDFYEDGHGKVIALLESRKDLRESIGIVVLSGSAQIFDVNKNFSFEEHVTGSYFEKYLDHDFPFHNDFLIDRSDNLWLSTYGGLYRLKGDEWDKYAKDEIDSKIAYDIAEDKNGNIWVGTETGVAEYIQGKWRIFDKNDGLKNSDIQKISVDGLDRIWAYNQDDLRSSTLNMFDGKKWTVYPSKKIHLKGTILNLFFVNGEVMAWTNKGVSRFKNSKWKLYEKSSGLRDKRYTLMEEDRQGKIWLVGEYRVYMKEGEKWNTLFKQDEELDAEIIFFDQNNSCWLGTRDQGIYHQTKESGWAHFNEENGLVNDNIKEIFEDRRGYIWIVTKKGLSMIVE